MNLETDVIARGFLAPVLIGQAMYLRRHALAMPEPEGPREGVTGQGADLRVLIVGDSSAAGVGVDSQDDAFSGQLVHHLGAAYRVHWRLLAKTGATTASTLGSLHLEQPGAYDIAVTSLGVNDVTHAVSLRRWLRDQAALHTLLGQKFGVRRSYISALPPLGQFPLLPQPLRWAVGSQVERFKRHLANLSDAAQGFDYVPVPIEFHPDMLARDGFHPSAALYAAWSGIMADHILKSLAITNP